jgi:hypothetical protein
MRTLAKRWESLKRVTGARHLYRAFLPEVQPSDTCWACIEAPALDGPFELEIWNGTENEWEFVEAFPTFKKAKAVGRLLAGVALNKNI